MIRTESFFRLATQVLSLLLLATMAFGQAAPPKPLSEADFTALLQARLQQVKDLPDLDDAAKTKIQDLYKQALAEMEAVKRWTAATTQNEQLVADAPKELERAKATLASPAPTAVALPANASLTQIEQKISEREAELEKLRKTLAADDAALKGGANKRTSISERLTKAKNDLTKLNEQLNLPAPSDENAAMNSARRMVLIAMRRNAEQQIACCDSELRASEARTELLPLQRDLGARQVAAAEQEIKQWQELVNKRRQREAEQQVEQASLEAGQAHPAVQGLLEENAKLAKQRTELAKRIVETTQQREQVNQQLRTLTDEFKRLQEKVQAVGKMTNATNAIGLMLRKKRESLPNLRDYPRSIAMQQAAIDEEQAQLDLLHDRRSALADLDQQTQSVLQHLKVSQQSDNRAELEPAVREALTNQRDYLNALINDHTAYFDKLFDLINAEQQLIGETDSFARFIDERVLWIASAGPLTPSDVRHAGDALWWLVGPNAWTDIGQTLVADAEQNPATWTLAVCMFFFLVYWRLRFRTRIQEIGEKTERGNCYRFLPTLEATLLTILVAVVWPGVMWYFGWRLNGAADASSLCKSLGEGLTETARVFLALELLRHTCRYRGLGESHFGWPASALKLLRQNIRWFLGPALVLMCVAVTMAWQDKDQWDASLGRISFSTAMLCFAWILHRVLRPSSAVFRAMIAERRGGFMERFRYVWYPIIALTPAALAIMAAVGYHYTARQLVIRAILTAYVLVGGLVCRALLLRWTLVNQRKLAIEQARQRRAAAQCESTLGVDAAGIASVPVSTQPERDLAMINTQTRRLVEYSLVVACALAVWCAWIDVLPALGSINASVGTTLVTTMKLESTYNGPKLVPVEELRDIKLSHILLAVIILAMTGIAAKNIPGLLEMAVLQHLPFDAGARYAVATVCRYVITILGVTICCGALGIGWAKIQWLVAAMSLGLGFGLQEIFANFVSGLIILFERPVRVGDVVTIDSVTGVVSRIRMRATTILDGDRKELIIPNKEFITGRVLNWTLTDPVNRVVINVGVAYGSDTQRAADILLDLAKKHPHVLHDPPPGVALESFGDSALNFVLRCFLPNMDNRGTVIHELHMAIDQEFRAAGIEIAFPQQDVHVRSIELPPSMVLPTTAGPGAVWPPSPRSNPTERAA